MAWAEQMQAVGVLETLGCVLGAYALGCFSTGYYLVRARTGRDIREFESGNIGARNVSRLLGRTGFVITFAGDFTKGVLAVWAARYFSGSDLVAAMAMSCVVAGHIWPATLHFHGGKGVATSLGALLAYDPQLAVAFVLCCLPGVLLLRRIILPGMLAYACLPVAGWWLHRNPVEATLLGVLAGLVILAHRRNLAQEIPGFTNRRDLSAKPHSPES